MPATPDDIKLAEFIGQFYDDPLGFVMAAYPWGEEPALRVAKLPEPWSLIYDSEYGPDEWACRMLDDIGHQVREHGFDGSTPVPAIREAIASGHGIGKSALVAWLVGWIMSTRPHCHGTVTATTSNQLSAKTWPEISKWNSRCITGHWFDVTVGKGAMAMKHRDTPDSWYCAAQTCDETNSEAFAGQHAADSTSFYIFDEATGVPDAIWDVAEGGLTDGEPMWFAFGNPTRNVGRFAECFTKNRHRWGTRQIDSRTVQITNKATLQQWVDDNGEDSDFVRVRIRGVFPRASSAQFIARDVVDEAAKREVVPENFVGRNCAVGVDVARFGYAQSVIRTRVGRDMRSIPAKRYRGLDTMQLAARVGEHVRYLRTLGLNPVLFVDGGGVGGGVIDRLRQLKHDVIEVQFGSKANDPKRYFNRRAELWGTLRDWLAVGCIEDSEDLKTELTAPEYTYSPSDQIKLQPKEEMHLLGLVSPDDADACALTLAMPVPDHPPPRDEAGAHKPAPRVHDPYTMMEA